MSDQTSNETTANAPRRLKGTEKLLVDMGPLVAMFIGYFFGGRIAPLLDKLFGADFFAVEGNSLFVAVALFLPAFAIAFTYSAIKERRVAPMLLVTAIVAVLLSILTLVLRDKGFTYIKPTITYMLFAVLLGGGQLAGRNFMKTLFDGALVMPDHAWKTLTWRFVGFFVFCALLNEVLWRSLTGDCVEGVVCNGEQTWFNIKIFGFTALYFVFLLSQGPFLAKHMHQSDKDNAKDDSTQAQTSLATEKPDENSKTNMPDSKKSDNQL